MLDTVSEQLGAIGADVVVIEQQFRQETLVLQC